MFQEEIAVNACLIGPCSKFLVVVVYLPDLTAEQVKEDQGAQAVTNHRHAAIEI